MLSPFPGMDPYIETPALWLEFHSNLATEIQAQLNRNLDPRYRAGLTTYVAYEIVEIAQVAGMFPDLPLWHEGGARATSGSAATIAPAPAESAVPLEASVDLHRIEIRSTG